MNRFQLMFAALALAGHTVVAQPVAAAPPVPNATSGPPNLANLMPPRTQPASPVAMFRALLSMSPHDREKYLTNRPSAVRAALRLKIRDYLTMDPDERELTLRETELRWQLLPLLRLAPAERAVRLAQVPDDLAPLVQSRLAEWDQLPTSTQQEFLANNSTLHYFAHVEPPPLPGADSDDDAHRQQIAAQFNQFFDLTPAEKQQTLKTLSATERAQMETTLAAFGKLTPQQRLQCIRAFTKFAELSPADRREFLKNAERWAQMSPKERQTWRDLVARVPIWPPLPPVSTAALMPPTATLLKKDHPAVATNQD